MSRNFDLLAEIERERDRERGLEFSTPNTYARVVDERPVVKEVVVPIQVSQPRSYAPRYTSSDAGGIGAEEMARLVQSVFLSANGSAPRQVVFCGVEEESGSGSVCAAAGRALAASTSKAVCLIDANVRALSLSGMLGADTTIPIFGKSSPGREDCVQIDGNLWLAKTELLTDEHGAILPVEELRYQFSILRGRFDYLLIDAPATNAGGDATQIGQAADAVVLVVKANSTRKLIARKAKESLDAAGVKVLGTVLRNRTFPIPEPLYKRI